MTNKPSSFNLRGPFYKNLFDALPGNYLLLQANAPVFTILAATVVRQQVVGMPSEAVIGRPLFEAHPGNSADPTDNGVNKLRASLEHVIHNRETHQLPVQRYDLPDENGSFSEKYWRASNIPVFDDEGQVAYIIHTAEDITDQIKAEKREFQIEGIEKAFDLFMDAPMVVGLVVGDHHVLEMANKEAFKLWGKGNDIIGKPILEALPELQGQNIVELFDHVRTTEQTYFAHEVPVASFADGKKEVHYFNLVYQPYYGNDSKKATGVFTISYDVTEQVQSRQRAEESEQRFRSMADASPVMIWTLDAQGNSVYYNKTATDFTGHTEQELKDGTTWQTAIHPDDIEFAGSVVSEAVQTGKPYQMECRMRRADGEWRWLLSHGMPRLDNNNKLLGYVGSSVDITEQKNSQRDLQAALEQVRLSKEAAELGTFDMNLEKGTMHWDSRCRTLFGISHHDTVTYDRDFVGGLHPDDRERVLALIDRLFIKSVSDGNYDVEYRTVGAVDGIIRWIRAKGKVYFNDQEKPVRFIGSVLDITEKVTAIQRIEALVDERTKELALVNETLQKTNKELNRSNQNLEEFAYAASHDLKEPVRKIHFYTTQLKDKIGNHLQDEHANTLSRMENATERMRNLIDDLLLYSHVSQRPQETQIVDLNVKVQRVLEDLDLEVEEKNAKIIVGELPVIKGYERQLQQLLQNLISNALKYSKKDVAPLIEICAKQEADNGRHYDVITVTDNGIGFQPRYADQIFQMFARLHGKNEYSGTGVGLSIVKKVVENHNGFIKVDSSPGQGSAFSIYLPDEP